MTALKKLIIWTIIIGAMSIALIMLFNDQNISVLIHKENIGNTALTWYKFDWVAYKNNLTTAINNTTTLELDIPQWLTVSSSNWADNLINTGINTVNGIILVINILIYPIKIGGYLLYFLIALFGINTGNGSSLYWLGQFSNYMIELSISYI